MSSDTSTRRRDDLLARAFLDELARSIGSNKPSLLTTKRNDAVEELIGDSSDDETSPDTVVVRPDVAAVAILVARAIGTVPGLVRELRRAAPVVVITTGSSNLVATAAQVVKTCAFGSDTEIVSGEVSRRHLETHERTAMLVARDGSNVKMHSPDVGNVDVATALQFGVPVVGVAADARRHLPRDLLRAAQANLPLGRLDDDAIRLVIEAVAGGQPSVPLDPVAVRTCDTSDLCLAIRPSRTPDECASALREVVHLKRTSELDGPRLEDMAGYGEAAPWGASVVADFENLRGGRLRWSDFDNRAVLLSGPPGVGKTQFAAALARSAQVPIVKTSVAEWNAATYLSGTLQAMGNAFSEAARLAPCILFIDELDGISDRGRIGGEYAEYWIQIVNRLLELLTAVRQTDGVVVVAATNYPEKIDPALRRAGRLDRNIEIGKPGFEDLLAIFRFYLRGELADASLQEVVFAAVGASGADVERWVMAARATARRVERPLSLDLLIETVRGSRKPMSASLRRAVSIHEAGHVVVGAALGNWSTHAVSIDDGGGQVTGTAELGGASKAVIMDLIVGLLAGRAAEETFGVATGGAGGPDGDLDRATRLAAQLETMMGFGSFGLVCVPTDDRHPLERFPFLIRPVSTTLTRCMDRAKAIVLRNKAAVVALADALESKVHLDAATVAGILQRFSPLHAEGSIENSSVQNDAEDAVAVS